MAKTGVKPALVTAVMPDSIGAELGFEPGDQLVAINGQAPRDLIDYQFLCADEALTLEVKDAQGRSHQVEIEKDYDDDLGLVFESALFDGLIQCNNRCPFCFIDQQPPGRRDTLYLKDDDYRLSFLYGSYLTLTNLTPPEWARIAQLRLSPLYVSVHATNPQVRARLLKNQRAGEILDQLAWFQARRLQIHAQVVVCPGINDGPELDRTLTELLQFHSGEVPTVASIAVVPVGLTRFRPPEDALNPVTPAKATEVIDQVRSHQTRCRQTLGATVVWLADEWFLIAGADLPPAEHYGDYPQIGNGVGSIRQFLQDFEAEAVDLPDRVDSPHHLTWVVGNAVEHAFTPIVHRFNQVEGLTLSLAALRSDYWGQEITVTGLLTGQDLIAGLGSRPLGDGLVLPSLMLKPGDSGLPEDTYFLDDMSVAAVADKLGVPIWPVADIAELIDTCLQPPDWRSLHSTNPWRKHQEYEGM